jgi:hypothetical protein
MRTILRITVVAVALTLLLAQWPFVNEIPNVPADSTETRVMPNGERVSVSNVYQRYTLRPGFCLVAGGELMALAGWWLWRKRRPKRPASRDS